MVGYSPGGGDGEERDRFWNDMDKFLDRVENEYRLCILGWIGDRTRAGITGAFGVPGENENGRRVVEFCAEMGLCVGDTVFRTRVYISTQGWQGVKMELICCAMCRM